MSKLLRRIRYWINRRRSEQELAEEMEFHRTLKQEELERSGLSSQDAGAASRREFGNTLRAREEAQDVWGWIWLDDLWRDARYAWRTLIKMPVLAAVVILSLGIGIGVNSAVFSWIQAMVLEPLPGVEHASAFYLVEPRADTGSYPGTSWPEYNDLRQRLHSFQGLISFRMTPLNVGETDRTERTYGLLVSDNYFDGLGLRPGVGRFFGPDETADRNRVVVISDGFWKTRFAADPGAIGRTLRVNDQLLTVIGVCPDRFQGTVLALDFDLWVPATLAPDLFGGTRELQDRSQRGYSVMGRLQPDATLISAQTELNAAAHQLAQAYPEASGKFEAEVMPYWRAPRGPQRLLLTGVVILQGLMLVMLLAICGNTANLLLARSAARAREIGTRLALGATRSRIVRSVMVEHLMLGLCGAGLGVLIAVWGTEALRAVSIYKTLPLRFQTGVDLTGLMFSVALGIVCALIFGAAPALQLVRGDPQTKLRSISTGVPHTRLRNTLMSIEAALALLVLLAAGLFFESFRDTRTQDPGFRVDGVLLSSYDLAGNGIGHLQGSRTVDPKFSRSFADKVLERVRTLPGVESAAIASSVPLDIHGLPLVSFRLDGNEGNNATPDRALINFVTPDYFRTMGIPQLQGTDFTALNDTATPPQAIVNQEFLRRFPLGPEPIGQAIWSRKAKFRVVGVVKNSFYDSFGEAPMPIIYFSYRESPRSLGQIHVRTLAGGETLLASDVRRVVREVEPGLPVFDVRTLSEHIETNLFLRRIPARLFTVLGPLLLFFAGIGIYSVVSYNVSHRITEIGVRMALGATSGRVVGQIVGETMRVIMYGALVGLAIAFIVYIHAVPGGPIDRRVFLGVPAILLIVAATACWLPARRAASLDPLIALREQ